MYKSPSEEDLIALESLLLVGKHKEATQKSLQHLEDINKRTHELHKQRHGKEKEEYAMEKKALRERHVITLALRS